MWSDPRKQRVLRGETPTAPAVRVRVTVSRPTALASQPRSSVARVRRGVRGCCKVPGTAVGALQPDLPDD